MENFSGVTFELAGESLKSIAEKVHLTKSEKKKAHWQNVLEAKRKKRKLKKLEKRERDQNSAVVKLCQDKEMLTKLDQKRILLEKSSQALLTGQQVCIDLSLEHHMSEKEKGRLAQQLGRIYGCNRKTENPLHIYLTGFDPDGFLYAECIRKNQGFQNYVWDVSNKPYTELFNLEKLIYLTPDSNKVLSSIEADKIYIIGGLVDESVQKRITLTSAEYEKVETARLPITKSLVKGESKGPSRILTVNQVVAIISDFLRTQDWNYALSANVPKRKGYLCQPSDTNSNYKL